MLKTSEGGKSLQFRDFCSLFQSLAAENWKERQPKEELALEVTSEIYLLERVLYFTIGMVQGFLQT